MGITKNVPRRKADRRYPMIAQPRVALIVALWTISHVVRRAIDFDAEIRPRAEEIEHVIARCVLLAKPQVRDRLQFAPEQNLGQ